ncbi:hypothetical protein ACLESD_52095, partial [Pyxidicoccus sp. 3LFB2]
SARSGSRLRLPAGTTTSRLSVSDVLTRWSQFPWLHRLGGAAACAPPMRRASQLHPLAVASTRALPIR